MYIKKYFYNDPLFKNSKVVYSVYNDDFKKPLNQEFAEKILLDGIKAKDVDLVKNPTFENISKLAVNYSDAVIKGTSKINREVETHIQSSGKLFLDYQPKETFIDVYNDFYDKV
jgi:starch synthase